MVDSDYSPDLPKVLEFEWTLLWLLNDISIELDNRGRVQTMIFYKHSGFNFPIRQLFVHWH